jgi:serine phosphatase RsbU (regulator of sigma subunit)
MPIGIFDLADKKFTTHNIDSASGELIYMFTDGYADQFGGPDRKKYKNSALKSLLLKIHKLPLIKQKTELEKEFNKWKGSNPQIDDVLILGLKI